MNIINKKGNRIRKMKDHKSENYYKKEIELGRWRIIKVKIINKKEID